MTRILQELKGGDPRATDRLLAAVYEELRRLAARKIRQERPGHTLQATALVHEAYLRLIGGQAGPWDNTAHFFGAAAEAMRRILIEAARRRARIKRGGGLERRELDEADALVASDPTDLLALDEALAKLAREDPVKAELVKLRYFAGLTVEQARRILGISRATADRYWTFARTWLYCEMGGEMGGEDEPAGSSRAPGHGPGRPGAGAARTGRGAGAPRHGPGSAGAAPRGPGRAPSGGNPGGG